MTAVGIAAADDASHRGSVTAGFRVETFDAGKIPVDANLTFCGSPLSASTADTCFDQGDLTPGVQYVGFEPFRPLAVVRANPTSSTALMAGVTGVPIEMRFDDSPTVVRLDISFTSSGVDAGLCQFETRLANGTTNTFSDDCPRIGNAEPRHETIAFGLPIKSISVTAVRESGFSAAPVIDNLEFGTPAEPTPTEPTPTEPTPTEPTPTEPTGPTPTIPAPSATPVPAVDRVAPDTRMRVLSKRAGKRLMRFSFASGEGGVTFQCSLDSRRAFTNCASGMRVRVRAGRHVLRARAVDAAGNRDPSPAKLSWVAR